jgi:glycosyltransferase involved in cell wall biosynthesis
MADGRVAVVVRTKNRPVLLNRALENILGQSYQDFSIAVVNDGGDPAPVDALAQGYGHLPAGKLTVIHHPQSKGMEAATNAGIAASASQYVAVHDDDDRWHPDFLLKTVGLLDGKTTAQGVAVRTNVVYEEVRDGAIVETGSFAYWPDLQAITLTDMLRINRIVPISFLYRRSVHEHIGFYNEELDVVGDWEFYLRFLQAYPMELLDDEPLAFWCQRPAASGDMGNSVIAAADEHAKFDSLVRDAFLRREAGRTGVGYLLYLAQLSGQQEEAAAEARVLADRVVSTLEDLNRRIAALEETVVRRTSVFEFVGRPARVAARLWKSRRKD